MNSRIQQAAFVAALAIVALATAEITARVDDRIRLGIPFARTPDYDHDLKYRDWFGIRGRPNGRYRRWKLDNYGFRGPDIEKTKTAGCARIMAIGASETFGLYESENREYPAQLRDSLRTHGCYEVINAAIVGAGIPAIVRLWEHHLAQFRPDVVLVYLSPTGYLAANQPVWGSMPGKAPPDVDLPLRPRLLEQLHNVWETPDFLQRRRLEAWIAADTRGKPDDWFFHAPPEDRLNLFIRDLDSLVKAIRSTGAAPILITHAMKFAVPPDPADDLLILAWRRYNFRATPSALLGTEVEGAKRVRSYAASQCIAIVDAERAISGKPEYFADFVHFTDQGAAAMASLVAQQIIAAKPPSTVGGGPCS